MNNFETMKLLLFPNKKEPRIKASTTIMQTSYEAKSYIGTYLSSKEIEKINSIPYFSGLAKDEYSYISKLEDLYIRKLTKDQKETKKEKEALARKIKERKDIELGNNVLGKRGLALDQKISQIEKFGTSFLHNTPDIKPKYKIEFAKDYLDRKPIDDEKIEPDIQRFNFNDVNNEVTCVETTPMNKVMVFGTITGKITAFYFVEPSLESNNLDLRPNGQQDSEDVQKDEEEPNEQKNKSKGK